MRNLCLILGDQLDDSSRLFSVFDADLDCLWMAEVCEESTHVWSHKQRIALFLSAMRHFAETLRERGLPLHYHALEDHDCHGLGDVLEQSILKHQPDAVRVVRPGDYRVLQQLKQVCRRLNRPLEILDDQHFVSTPKAFREWASGRKQLRMEYWYRQLRQQHGILLNDEGGPAGGQWNYDAKNRKAFAKTGPKGLVAAPEFEQDAITRQVIALVNERFNSHPGQLETLNWAVTRNQAEVLSARFLNLVLPSFGDYQDAMWGGEPFLHHSLLSAALNLKLLHPLEVIRQAEDRYRAGDAPLAAVEGFIRQILGWREYVRGLYWLNMPDWLEWNALNACEELPAFYWTADTEIVCLHETLQQTLQHGYAHHIQRLMVTGLFAQLLGVAPDQVHQWYLAIYVDAVEWVELPNTLGMSQYSDGGRMASKPYVASGNYINKMSNYCQQCCYQPGVATGDKACPFTTLFWDFLERHADLLNRNPRMGFMMKNLQRKSVEERDAIGTHAEAIRQRYRLHPS